MKILGPTPDLVDKADLFRALGDINRLRILALVRARSLCVRELVDALETPQATVSHHLKVLAQAGLVISSKEGRENHYRATKVVESPIAVF